jgi:hypothetical protein
MRVAKRTRVKGQFAPVISHARTCALFPSCHANNIRFEQMREREFFDVICFALLYYLLVCVRHCDMTTRERLLCINLLHLLSYNICSFILSLRVLRRGLSQALLFIALRRRPFYTWVAWALFAICFKMYMSV